MSWYRAGTVTVTNGSKTVTGVDTLFTTAVNAGDAFALVDANLNPTGAWYEIDAVVSNTELTLKQSYAGSTGSNNQYSVFNLVGNMTTPAFSQRLATFFASFQTLLDMPTSTPTALSIPIADANGNIADGWISAALLELHGATVFKGTLGTNGTVTALPTADYLRGWTYRIVTAGTYAGIDCALGDLIIALSSFDTEFKNSDWIPVHIADEMNLKADVTYVDAELALKANIVDVDDALALKAPLNSPTFTGDVIVPDQTAGNNSTKAANTKYADAKVADAINDGVTGIAPSQNAVFDALALKADLTYVEYLMMEGDPA